MPTHPNLWAGLALRSGALGAGLVPTEQWAVDLQRVLSIGIIPSDALAEFGVQTAHEAVSSSILSADLRMAHLNALAVNGQRLMAACCAYFAHVRALSTLTA